MLIVIFIFIIAITILEKCAQNCLLFGMYVCIANDLVVAKKLIGTIYIFTSKIPVRWPGQCYGFTLSLIFKYCGGI